MKRVNYGAGTVFVQQALGTASKIKVALARACAVSLPLRLKSHNQHMTCYEVIRRKTQDLLGSRHRSPASLKPRKEGTNCTSSCRWCRATALWMIEGIGPEFPEHTAAETRLAGRRSCGLFCKNYSWSLQTRRARWARPFPGIQQVILLNMLGWLRLSFEATGRHTNVGAKSHRRRPRHAAIQISYPTHHNCNVPTFRLYIMSTKQR